MGSGGADRNARRIAALSSDFQYSYAPDFAWKTAASSIMMLPGLRGAWLMSQFDSAGDCIDQSGHGHTLTYTVAPTYSVQGLAPYCDFRGVATGDCLNRLDEADFDFIGNEPYIAAGIQGCSMGGWFKVDTVPTGATGDQLIGKGAPVLDTAFHLIASTVPMVFALIASNTGIGGGGPGSALVSTGTWYFVAGVFTPSTTLELFVDDTRYSAVTAWATLNNSAGSFCIGGQNAATWFLDGQASLCWACATALSQATVRSLYQGQRALFGK